MSVIIGLIFGEIIRPIVFGIGWVIVWLATIGLVRPKKETFFKYPVVGLLGAYTLAFAPATIIYIMKSNGS